jgi:hypothetical protein
VPKIKSARLDEHYHGDVTADDFRQVGECFELAAEPFVACSADGRAVRSCRAAVVQGDKTYSALLEGIVETVVAKDIVTSRFVPRVTRLPPVPMIAHDRIKGALETGKFFFPELQVESEFCQSLAVDHVADTDDEIRHGKQRFRIEQFDKPSQLFVGQTVGRGGGVLCMNVVELDKTPDGQLLFVTGQAPRAARQQRHRGNARRLHEPSASQAMHQHRITACSAQSSACCGRP